MSGEAGPPQLRVSSNAWARKEDDSPRQIYVAMSGRVSISDLLAYIATVDPNVSPDDLLLNFATVTWQREATDEERAERAAWQRESDAKHEKWERETVVRLAAKYPELIDRTAP